MSHVNHNVVDEHAELLIDGVQSLSQKIKSRGKSDREAYIKLNKGLYGLLHEIRDLELYPARSEVDVMARTIWGEAQGEGFLGMRAAAHVINNRKNSEDWPDTIELVCKQPYQFSVWNDNDPNLSKIEDVEDGDVLFDMAQAISERVLSGYDTDITGGADHYHAVYVDPDWADDDKITARIGLHIFYKLNS